VGGAVNRVNDGPVLRHSKPRKGTPHSAGQRRLEKGSGKKVE